MLPPFASAANGRAAEVSALRTRVRRTRVRASRGVVRGQGEDIARGACTAAAAHRRRQAAAQRTHAV